MEASIIFDSYLPDALRRAFDRRRRWLRRLAAAVAPRPGKCALRQHHLEHLVLRDYGGDGLQDARRKQRHGHGPRGWHLRFARAFRVCLQGRRQSFKSRGLHRRVRRKDLGTGSPQRARRQTAECLEFIVTTNGTPREVARLMRESGVRRGLVVNWVNQYSSDPEWREDKMLAIQYGESQAFNHRSRREKTRSLPPPR